MVGSGSLISLELAALQFRGIAAGLTTILLESILMVKIDWGMWLGSMVGGYMIFGWRYRYYPLGTRHVVSAMSGKLLYCPDNTAWFRSQHPPSRWWPVTNRRKTPPDWFERLLKNVQRNKNKI